MATITFARDGDSTAEEPDISAPYWSRIDGADEMTAIISNEGE
ncbi:hypothetical protein [Haloferax sp. DFSO52]